MLHGFGLPQPLQERFRTVPDGSPTVPEGLWTNMGQLALWFALLRVYVFVRFTFPRRAFWAGTGNRQWPFLKLWGLELETVNDRSAVRKPKTPLKQYSSGTVRNRQGPFGFFKVVTKCLNRQWPFWKNDQHDPGTVIDRSGELQVVLCIPVICVHCFFLNQVNIHHIYSSLNIYLVNVLFCKRNQRGWVRCACLHILSFVWNCAAVHAAELSLIICLHSCLSFQLILVQRWLRSSQQFLHFE